MKTESIIEYISSIENIENCTELTINKFDITGEILCVDLNDLYYFPNIKKLTLCDLILNQQDMIVVMSLVKLNRLELYNCEFSSDNVVKYINEMQCKELLLDNTNIDFNVINRNFDKVIIKNMNLNKSINCNILDISKSIVNFNNFDLKKCNKIILSKSQYDSYELLLKSYIGQKKLIIMNDYYDVLEAEYE